MSTNILQQGVLLFLFLLVAAVNHISAPYNISSGAHITLEAVSISFALVTSIICLIRFYTYRTTDLLFLGLGFMGTFLLDLLHVILIIFRSTATSHWNIVVWTWLVSRTFLGLFLLLFSFSHKKGSNSIQASVGYTLMVIMVVAAIALFPLIKRPLIQPIGLIERPLELIPALLLLAASIRLSSRQPSRFLKWACLSIITGVGVNIIMAFSGGMDELFTLSHVLKIVSYGMFLIALLMEIFSMYKDHERQNEELRSEIDYHEETQQKLKELTQELEKKVTERTASLKDSNLSLSREVREREAFQKRLEEKNQDLQDFAHIVSHDLKAPLRAIHTMADWIKEDENNKLSKETLENLDVLREQTKLMNNMIERILSYSKSGTSSAVKEEVNINMLVEDVISAVNPPENVRVKVSEKMPVLTVDRIQIFQAFQNLLQNAVKYMDKENGIVEIGAIEQEYDWKFYVKDNGPGVDPKYHKIIFDFFRSGELKRDSTGLGLAVVKKVIELNHGKVWVESVRGEGATFYFTLPKPRTE